ncbi:MAG: hypothetical protein AAGA75_25860 [Cyanobacteria bacterium P01_E01_bin.6]
MSRRRCRREEENKKGQPNNNEYVFHETYLQISHEISHATLKNRGQAIAHPLGYAQEITSLLRRE